MILGNKNQILPTISVQMQYELNIEALFYLGFVSIVFFTQYFNLVYWASTCFLNN